MTDQNHDPDETPIEKATQRVRDAATATRTAEIPLLTQAHQWRQNHVATIEAQPGPRPTILIWDNENQGWRGIVLDDGTRWVIACSGRTDGLVVPGGSVQ